MRIVLLIVTVLFVTDVFSQPEKQYFFTHYNLKDGLASYDASSIIQDENGFLWIGTANGLQRFDGKRFLTFRHSNTDKNSIPDNYIHQILYDSKKNLWVLFGNGMIGRFDTKKFIYKDAFLDVENRKYLQADRRLVEDSKGNLFYVVHVLKLMMYNFEANEFSAKHCIIRMPPRRRLQALVEDQTTGRYWIGTDSGMVVYNIRNDKLSYHGHNEENLSFINNHGSIEFLTNYLIDNKGRLWYQIWPSYGGPYLYCYDLRKDKMILDKYFLGFITKMYHEPWGVVQQKDGTIWVRGLNLFVRYDEERNDFVKVTNGYTYNTEQGIYYKKVTSLLEDKEQNLWVTTNNNGIYFFNPKRELFTSIRHIVPWTKQLGSGGVLSFIHLNSGEFLSGAWGEGLYKYDSNLNSLENDILKLDPKASHSIWSMCRLKDNRTIWIGMQPGVFVYDQVNHTAKYYNTDLLGNRTIRQVAEDTLGNMWLGTQSLGLFKWTKSKAEKNFEQGFSKYEEIPNTQVASLYTDSKGYLWVCTNVHGVYKIDPRNDKIVSHFTDSGAVGKKLLFRGASGVLEYDDTTFIIVAQGLNVLNTKTQRFSYITAMDGLPSEIILSIQKDRKGFLWLGLLHGICRMNLQKKMFTYFDRNDGMTNDNFIMASSYQLPDGRLLFGTTSDFIVFNPEDVQATSQPPDITITDFRMINKSLLIDSIRRLNRVELLPEDNSFSVNFSAPGYFQKSKLVYYYMLEGIDKDWRKADESNQAVYNYLPPGSYTFRVKGENADGVSSKNITELRIKVKPHFWRTWWFLGLLAFLAVGVFYWVDKLKVQRIRDTERVRTRIATSLTRDMTSTLSNINVLSEMAIIKAESDLKRTKEYISQISDSSFRMMEVMDDMVWSINPQNDEMKYTISRMKKYAGEIESQFKIDITFNADISLHEVKLDMNRRHELFLIYKEALLNIGRHARSRYVDIRLQYKKPRIIMKIVDDGRGFDIQALSFGRGITEMKKRATGMKADLEIRSEINTGTTIILEMTI